MRIIAGRHRGRQLILPKGLHLRPSMSETRQRIFNICQNEVHGAIFLDLFAGIGSIGLEALSRGATCVHFVEKEINHLKAIKSNLQLLEEESHAFLYKLDCFEALERFAHNCLQFDIIFADPPYSKGPNSLSDQIILKIDKFQLLKPDGLLLVEECKEGASLDLPLKNLKLCNHRLSGNTCIRKYETLSSTCQNETDDKNKK